MIEGSGRGRFADLDGMRGILACCVMLLHLGLTPAITRATGGFAHDSNWGLSVDFFFMLSGFVLFESLKRRPPDLRLYFRARAFRLYPVFLVTTLAMIAIGDFRYGWFDVATNLLFLNHVFGIENIDGPAWSISFEFFLPAILMLLIHRRATLSTRWLAPLLVVALSCHGLILLLSGPATPFSWLGRAWFGLAAGMAGANMLQRLGYPLDRRATTFAAFGATIGCMVLAGVIPLLMLVFPFLAMTAIAFGARAGTLLGSRPLQLLGALSYAIYLWHVPMLAFVDRFVATADGNLATKALVIALTFALALLTRRFVERPMMRRASPGARAEAAP